MFTGIVQSQGALVEIAAPRSGADGRLVFEDALAERLAIGGSVAVNGVCLSAVALDGARCRVEVSAETWRLSALSALSAGERVNLELPLRADGLLGGHWVSGHVDGVAEALSAEDVGGSRRFRFRAPAALSRYVAAKGSVCLDGVSLTVNRVDGAEFEVNVVAHTLWATRFSGCRPGSAVNLEVDVVARYLERLLERSAAGRSPSDGR